MFLSNLPDFLGALQCLKLFFDSQLPLLMILVDEQHRFQEFKILFG